MNANFQTFTADEEYKLAIEAKTGNKDALNQIVLGIYGIIRRSAVRAAEEFNQRQDIDDLVQIGIERALKSINTYDLSRRMRYATYVLLGIRNEYRRYLIAKNRVVTLPNRIVGRRHKKGNLATEEQMVKMLKSQVLSYNKYLLADECNSPLERLIIKDCYARIKLLLSDNDYQLLQLHYKGKTYRQIGKELGVSHQAINQRFRRIYEEIRVGLRLGMD